MRANVTLPASRLSRSRSCCFLARFLALARERTPGRKVLPTGQLTVLIDGAPLALDQHYRALTCEPDMGDAVFDRIFAYLTTAEPPSTEVKFDEVKSSILLTIKPREWLESADRNVPERSRVLRIPFPNDTAIVFVVDHPHVMRFVSVEESERWEVPPKEMFPTYSSIRSPSVPRMRNSSGRSAWPKLR